MCLLWCDMLVLVVPHAGTWIEIPLPILAIILDTVVPHAGTWIEIHLRKFLLCGSWSFPTRERGLKSLWRINIPENSMSFPTRERGLKSKKKFRNMCTYYVVPHAGTWIEIIVDSALSILDAVVPHAGTWIEIMAKRRKITDTRSFPTRERGLK